MPKRRLVYPGIARGIDLLGDGALDFGKRLLPLPL